MLNSFRKALAKGLKELGDVVEGKKKIKIVVETVEEGAEQEEKAEKKKEWCWAEWKKKIQPKEKDKKWKEMADKMEKLWKKVESK